MSNIKALGLISGGLDSMLAARLLMEQKIHVEGIYFFTGFCTYEDRLRVPRNIKATQTLRHDARKAADNLDIPIHIQNVTDDYLDLVTHPRYGRGSAFNPCIDCRIYMLVKAGKFMEENGFHFIFTGEVKGQRPMTQQSGTLNLIARQCGLEGLLLRPLSARLLPETIPEQKGWVDRSLLLDIHGRGRKRQMELAHRFGLKDYPNPAGGCCFLTDPHLKKRFLELFRQKDTDDVTMEDFQLVKHGRHFRLSDRTRLIVGRDAAENFFLEEHARGRYYLDATLVPGPSALLEGHVNDDILTLALRITARYSDVTGPFCEIMITTPEGDHTSRQVSPLTPAETESLLI